MLYLAWIFYSAVSLIYWPIHRYKWLDLQSQWALSARAGEALCWVIFSMAIVFFTRLAWIKQLLFNWCMFYSFWILVGLPHESMDAGFIAITLPTVFERRTKWLPIIPIVAIFYVQSMMGIGTLAIVLVYYFRAWLLASILTGIFIAFNTSTLHSSFRFEMWKACYEWWKQNANPWIGTGLGSFELFGPKIQNVKHHWFSIHGNWFHRLHSDWLQAGFEMGYIGLGLAVICFILALHKTRKTIWLSSAIAGLGFLALGDYPFHDGMGIVLISLLIVGYLKDEDSTLAI